jgi:type IV secretory pathway VirB2 component (pilin)
MATEANFTEAIHFVSALFFELTLLCIVIAGLVMMFAPSLGWRVLKNVAVGVAIFILGRIILDWVH